MSKVEVIRLFHAIDQNQSGHIDYTEFIASFLGSKVESNKKYLEQIFYKYDKDRDGYISKDEVREVLFKDSKNNLHTDKQI